MPSDLIDSSPSPLYKPFQWTPCSLNMVGMPQTWSLFNFLSGTLFFWISHFLTSFIFLLKYHFLTEALPDTHNVFHCVAFLSPILLYFDPLWKLSPAELLYVFILFNYLFLFELQCCFPKAKMFFPLLYPKWYNGTWF